MWLLESAIRKFFGQNKILGATLIYTLGTFLLRGLTFLTTPIFTRVMQPSDYGVSSIFATWVAFFAVFIGCQVTGSVATARIHMGSSKFHNFMGNITFLSMLSAAVFAAASLIYRAPLARLLSIKEDLIPFLLIQAYGSSLSALYSMYLIQTKQPKRKIAYSVLVSLSVTLLALMLVLNMESNRYLGKIWAGTIVNCGIIVFVLYYFLKFREKRSKYVDDWKYCLKLSLPLIIHLGASAIIGQSDRIFIVNIMSEVDVGIYNVAYSIGLIGMVFADACNNAWTPWYFDNTRSGNAVQINHYARFYMMGIASLFFVLLVLSPEILKFMAPEPYWTAVYTLLVTISGVFFQFLYRFPLGYEQYSGKMKWVAVCTITAALVNIGLNSLLIPIIGLEGAALATFLSYLLLFLAHEFVARRVIGGYNIRMDVYLPSIVICMSGLIVSAFTVEYWYIRVTIAVSYVLIFVYGLHKKRKHGAVK